MCSSDLLCVEGCGDLTVGAPSLTQFDDARRGFLLSLDRLDVAVASLVRGDIPEGIVAHCLMASGCLREAKAKDQEARSSMPLSNA